MSISREEKDRIFTKEKNRIPGVCKYHIKSAFPNGIKYTMRKKITVDFSKYRNISPGPAAYNPNYFTKNVHSYTFDKNEKNFVNNNPGVGDYDADVSQRKLLKHSPSCIFGHESSRSLANFNLPNNFNRSIVDDPGVGTYYPDVNFVKKKTISFSFEKKPRKLENYKYYNNKNYKNNFKDNKNKSNIILLNWKRKIKNYYQNINKNSFLNHSNVSFDSEKNIKIIRDISSQPKKKINLNNISSYSFYLKNINNL